jgi:hypothetical protein
MNKDNSPPDEDFQIRCPRLGHQIVFSYCRVENEGLPCFKALDCWHQHFSVEEYFQKEITQDQWKKAFSRPTKNKMFSLLEMIEQTKKRMKEEEQ